MAVGVHEEYVLNGGHDFDSLDVFVKKHKKWVFGFMSYDLKNQVENLTSENNDGLSFPEMCFFVPKVVFQMNNDDSFEILANYDQEFSENINPFDLLKPEPNNEDIHLSFNSRTPKEKYLSDVTGILKHIQRGDIYEANYCVEFFQENISLAPLATYNAANDMTSAPYSCYFQHNEIHAICCSPELYLEKEGSRLVSKPIKGTVKRGDNEAEDEKLKLQLLADEKERSENVMIVDLVRNDLSKTAKKSSVKVDELFGIYTFKTLHHMISTVSSEIKEGVENSEIIKTTFPMGSMTGAPKISAMKIIEKFEESKRGLYSGAIGFFTPEGDFTFNVVIRSLLYNSEKKYLSLMAGGAITASSKPESEYRECLLKVSALKKAVHAID